jgi:hypothetical protein
MSRSFVRPQNGVPEKLMLASPGVVKDGMYGPQKLYMLTDGRCIYLDLEVAQRVEHTVQIGQEFWLVRHARGSGRKANWDIHLEDPAPKPPEPETDLERDLRLSIEQAEARKAAAKVTPIASPPVEEPPAPVVQISEQITRKIPGWAGILTTQTNTLIDAYAHCLSHAAEHGLVVKPEDVRTLLVTAFIGLQQRGKGRTAA